jgi:hypothetical protein
MMVKGFKHFTKALYCPNASTIKRLVREGDFVHEGNTMARVLGLATHDENGRKYAAPLPLLVLVANPDLSYGYMSTLSLDKVDFIDEAPGDFTLWFLFGSMPKDLNLIEEVVNDGSMSNTHLGKLLGWVPSD